MRIRVNPVVLVIAALLICLAAIAIVTHAQSPPLAPPSSKYVPTEVQSARLRAFTQAAQAAWNEYQRAVGELNSESERVKTENKWPASVQYNPQTGGYIDTTPAATPSPAKPALAAPPPPMPGAKP